MKRSEKIYYLSVGSRDVGESDRSVESLILFWVVVSQTDLEFNRFDEFSLLSVGEHFSNALLKVFGTDLTMRKVRKREGKGVDFTSWCLQDNLNLRIFNKHGFMA